MHADLSCYLSFLFSKLTIVAINTDGESIVKIHAMATVKNEGIEILAIDGQGDVSVSFVNHLRFQVTVS